MLRCVVHWVYFPIGTCYYLHLCSNNVSNVAIVFTIFLFSKAPIYLISRASKIQNISIYILPMNTFNHLWKINESVSEIVLAEKNCQNKYPYRIEIYPYSFKFRVLVWIDYTCELLQLVTLHLFSYFRTNFTIPTYYRNK